MSSQLPTALLASVVTLGLVVIVHELGHFLFCKMFGIYVKTFSIGMGPKLLRWKRGETEYVLSAVPFGGYVKMAGEGMMEEIQDTGTWEERKYPLGTAEGNREAAALDEDIPAHRLFSSRPVWQRLLVFIAGPLFNLVLAWIIYTGMMTVEGVRLEPFTRVGSVEAGSPAALAGIAVGDSITAVGGKAVATWDDVLANVLAGIPSGAKTAPAVPLTVIRDGAPVDLAMTPVVDDSTGRWHLGMDTWNTAVGRVQKEGPADRLGLREGDVIVEVAGRQVTSFAAVAGVINESAGEPVALRWRRGAQLLSGTVTPELNEVAPGRSVGRIFYEPYYTYERLSLGKAVVVGWKQTVGMVRMMIVELGKLVGRKHG
ncbi:MAG TPA: site-2 protease family protein, partial [Candidatus Krumholzibacteria bacterium]|nr:site-2 protease family protein [Candidatus Krumholzibacteria bacterium]